MVVYSFTKGDLAPVEKPKKKSGKRRLLIIVLALAVLAVLVVSAIQSNGSKTKPAHVTPAGQTVAMSIPQARCVPLSASLKTDYGVLQGRQAWDKRRLLTLTWGKTHALAQVNSKLLQVSIS